MCFSRKNPPLFITVILSYNFFADGPIFGNKCFLFPISVSLHQILGAQIICDQKYWNRQRNSVTNTKEDSPRTALWRILQKKILRQRQLRLKRIGFQKAFRDAVLNLGLKPHWASLPLIEPQEGKFQLHVIKHNGF